MFKLNEKVRIKKAGIIGEVIDISPNSPPSYAVEWEDGDSYDWKPCCEAELEKVDTDE